MEAPQPATPVGASVRVFDGIPLSSPYPSPTGDRIQIQGQWWYRTMMDTRGLFSRISMEECSRKFLVCLQRPAPPGSRTRKGKTRETERWYTCFESYLEFHTYQLQIPPLERSFYEIILGTVRQKPHFDLDLDVGGYLRVHPEGKESEEALDLCIQTCLESLIEGCLRTIPQLRLPQDFMIFSSHGLGKRSYHVVLPNHCYLSNVETRALYDDIMDLQLPESTFIDHSVYSTKQQFRILGSQKSFSGRPKVLSSFSYRGTTYSYSLPETPRSPEHQDLIVLGASLVSFTSHCSCLPPSPRLEHKKGGYQGTLTIGDLPEELVTVAVTLLHQQDPAHEPRKNGVKGNVIEMDRVRRSRCRICHRPHDNDNSRITIRSFTGTPDGPLVAYWRCYRDSHKRYLLLGPVGRGSLPVSEGSHFPSPREEGPIFSFGSFQYPGVPSPHPTSAPVPQQILPPPELSLQQKMEQAVSIHQEIRRAKLEKKKKKEVPQISVFSQLREIPW